MRPLALHLARVQPHPRPEAPCPDRAPVLPLQGELPGEGRGHGVRGAAKAAYTASPTVSNTTPPWASTAAAEEGVVAGHRLPVGVRVRLEQRGAALQVGEQEGHRAGREGRARGGRRRGPGAARFGAPGGCGGPGRGEVEEHGVRGAQEQAGAAHSALPGAARLIAWRAAPTAASAGCPPASAS